MSPFPRSRLLLVGFWVLPALVGTLGLALVPSRLNPDLSLGQLLASQLLLWLAWGGWALVIVAVGTRFPFGRGRIGPALAAHLPLMVVVVLGQILVVNGVTLLFGMAEPRGLDSTLLIGLRQYGDLFTVVFWAIVGARMAFGWYAAWQEESVAAARLGQDLAEAQLRALQSQLNPHFLFNALNSVVSLIGRDPPTAQRTVIRLADLLRATLRLGEAQEATLAQELELTRRYLELEQLRFADRLSVEWETDGLPDAVVPAFALQPLVENAVIHGIGPKVGPGRIIVRGRMTGDRIRLEVEDDGRGLDAPPGREGGGLGLVNLRARLARLYGALAVLELGPAPRGGTVAALELPFRPAPATGPTGTDSSSGPDSEVPGILEPSAPNFSH